MSKIASVTIVTQQGTKLFSIGGEYNNLTLDNINDESEFNNETFYASIYRGYTKDGKIVFETVNAPVEVSYMLVA